MIYIPEKGSWRLEYMGYYINPRDKTKEQYLAACGEELPSCPKWTDIPQGKVLVCWINNGFMTAAAIAYSERELEDFTRPNDPRPKKWFLLSFEDAVAASDWRGPTNN